MVSFIWSFSNHVYFALIHFEISLNELNFSAGYTLHFYTCYSSKMRKKPKPKCVMVTGVGTVLGILSTFFSEAIGSHPDVGSDLIRFFLGLNSKIFSS